MAEGKRYRVNEVFYSVQGEGGRAGEASVFVRFAGCNLRCRQEAAADSPGGFDCDTEFASGRWLTVDQLLEWVDQELTHGGLPGPTRPATWVVLTGGEPALQLDLDLVGALRSAGYRLAVETNGTVELPYTLWNKDMAPAQEPVHFLWRADPQDDKVVRCYPFDWITVSPKVAEHAVRQLVAHEVRYVRAHGQAVPKPRCQAVHKFISPAFQGLEPDQRAVAWCVQLCKEFPAWRLSLQSHKFVSIR